MPRNKNKRVIRKGNKMELTKELFHALVIKYSELRGGST